MGQIIPILATAGATAAGVHHKNRQNRKLQRSSISDRIKLGEQHGIHPLQMLGSAGTAMGTGGANLGQMVADEFKSRSFKKEQRRQEARQDESAMEQRAHEKELANIRAAADNMRVQLMLDRENRSPDVTDHANQAIEYFAPGAKAIDGWVDDAFDKAKDTFGKAKDYLNSFRRN